MTLKVHSLDYIRISQRLKKCLKNLQKIIALKKKLALRVKKTSIS